MGVYGYSQEVIDYAKVRIEQSTSDITIGREIKSKFGLESKTDECMQMVVQRLRKKEKLKKNAKPKRRLFFDIETSYMIARVWRCGQQYIQPDNLMNETKIICISYKWEGEDKVYSLKWDKNQDDASMMKKFIKVLGDADEIIGHNVDKFDIAHVRTRALKHGNLMYPTYRTLDTLTKSRKYFNFPSNKLDYIGKYLGVGKKLEHEGFKMWIDVVENKCEKALKKMIEYCEQDVILLEDVYTAISPYIYHNTNFAVLHGKDKWDCPECTSENVEMYHTYTTPMGVIRRNMRCGDCNKQYRVSNRTYMQMLVSNSRGI